MLSGWFLLIKYWQLNWRRWDWVLRQYQLPSSKNGYWFAKLNYFNFPSLVPASIRPLFVKEILAHIRNPHYMRLKLISLILYIISIGVAEIYLSENYDILILILTLFLIWEHYSHQFNEKYVSKEPINFFKALPFKYYQYSLAKFFSESLYILIIIIICMTAAFLHGLSPTKILNLLVIITVFAFFILYLITIIRIIFYDNPRFAGYAYHFLVIFTFVMSWNFYLVGPFITLMIILYLHFWSYRIFVK
jgi:hypothetical protein